MREIKFRAWCEAKRRYFLTDEMVNDQFALLPNGFFANISGRSTLETRIFTHEEYLPEQFTGQKDKNGMEIYEGDITSIHWSQWSWVAVVEWDTENPCFVLHTIKGNRVTDYEYDFSKCRLMEHEVIGNIHESKYLLD